METPGLSPWFVTGFVDGEGTFTYGRSGKSLALVFAIKLTATDRSLLEKIRKFFGGSGTRPVELLRVVDHFDRYPLQGEKRVPYGIWREMVFLKAAYVGGPIPEELDRMARELSRAVPRNRPRT